MEATTKQELICALCGQPFGKCPNWSQHNLKKKRFKVVFALSYEVEAENDTEAIDVASDRFNDDVENAILKQYEAPSNFFPSNAEELEDGET